jgi:hypothetical protein
MCPRADSESVIRIGFVQPCCSCLDLQMCPSKKVAQNFEEIMWQYETIAPAISAANRISLSAQRMKAVFATSATSMTYLLADASTRTTPGQLLPVAYLALSVPGRVFVAEVALIHSNGCYPGRQARGAVLRNRRRYFQGRRTVARENPPSESQFPHSTTPSGSAM